MTPARGFIETGLCNIPDLVPLLQIIKHLLLLWTFLLTELVDIDTLDAFSHVQVLVCGINQIVHTFVINLKNSRYYFKRRSKTYLHVADCDRILAFRISLNRFKHLFNAQWDQTGLVILSTAAHCESFAWGCLTVRENCLIYAIQGVVH